MRRNFIVEKSFIAHTWGKVEVVWPPDDEVGDFGGKDNASEDTSFPLAHQ